MGITYGLCRDPTYGLLPLGSHHAPSLVPNYGYRVFKPKQGTATKRVWYEPDLKGASISLLARLCMSHVPKGPKNPSFYMTNFRCETATRSLGHGSPEADDDGTWIPRDSWIHVPAVPTHWRLQRQIRGGHSTTLGPHMGITLFLAPIEVFIWILVL